VQIGISARHGHLSEASQEKIREKVDKLNRFFDRLTAIEVTVDLEHRETPRIDLRVSAEHKHDFGASIDAGELMAGVDAVVQKVEEQLRRYKEKRVDRHRGGKHRQLEPETETESESPGEQDEETPVSE
jgi:putative sigma-54 modulation protein